MIPYWAEVRHEDVWTHYHPWYALEHSPVSWMSRIVSRVRGKTVAEVIADAIDDIGWMTVVGGGMMVLGTVMLIPGPVMFAVGMVGAYFGGPPGAAIAMGAYMIVAVLLIVGGAAMIYFD